MHSEAFRDVDVRLVGDYLRNAIAHRYAESGADRYCITPERFQELVAAVVARYAGTASGDEQVELVGALQVKDLVLARACSDGNEAAWEVFLTRYRAPLYEAAYRIAKDEAAGRELADELYADLYGMPGSSGQRRSKLDYYMGRGSFEGWLRTVLSQQYVNRYRSRRREVSLDQELEKGVGFPAPVAADENKPPDCIGAAIQETLGELSAEERFLLASWYLDQRTLADIGRQLGVHESTISRRIERLTATLRKRVRKRLQQAGLGSQECEEVMRDLDVRDLNVDVTATLEQETPLESFHK